MTTRREFLKTGVAGVLLLKVAGCTRPAQGDGRTVVLTALIPVLLDGAQPSAGATRPELITRTVAGVDKAVAGLSLATQKEVGELFDLLSFAPTRMILFSSVTQWAKELLVGGLVDKARLIRA